MNTKRVTALRKEMSKPEVMSKIRQMQIDFQWNSGWFGPSSTDVPDPTLMMRSEGLTATFPSIYVPHYVSYESIADKINGIGGGTSVMFSHEEEFMSGGITFKIGDYVKADLPPEDIILLESMGKVESSINKASISQSIFCPTAGRQP